jgi:hypothetical protein
MDTDPQVIEDDPQAKVGPRVKMRVWNKGWEWSTAADR